MRELRIVDAPGSPKMGEACGQWVFDLAASIFGSYDAESGKRLITEWFVMLPKKNFKSGLAASIMLTCLIRNWRHSAEFTILAPTLEVANNSFGPARDMVQFDGDEDEPNELGDLIHVQTHIKTLTHREKNAALKVVATDANTVAGKKSVGTLVEELWLFGKQANAKEMLREALGGLASRPEGFVIYLTTQSDEPPAGVYKEKLQYARDVRDGKIHDPQFLPIIYEHPPELVQRKEHLKLENLPMVNPNMGYSVGDLTIVDRPGDDVAAVADRVCQIRDAGLLPEKHAAGVDAAGIGDIVDELTSPGRDITMEQIVAISQGWKLNGAIKTTERKLAGGEMVHGGSRLMNYCVGNARIVQQGNAVSITKQISGSTKIDPLMATFNAVSLMSLNPQGSGNIDDFIRTPLSV